MQGGNTIQEIGMPADKVGELGLRMLSVLSFIFSAHFQHESVLNSMLGLLSYDYDYVAPYILKAFTHLGKYRPLVDSFPVILAHLLPICKEMALNGTPKQAKHALRCLFVNIGCADGVRAAATAIISPASVPPASAAMKDDEAIVVCSIPNKSTVQALTLRMFGQLVDSLKHMNPAQPNYRTSIVLLGHIAYNLPDRYQVAIKNIVSRKIVRELLVGESLAAAEAAAAVADDEDEAADADTRTWCSEDELPETTRCKVEGMKTMARWLMGLKQDINSAAKTFRMLNAFMERGGNLMDTGHLTMAETSWLRLSAGTAMLKICEQKGVGDQYCAEQLYALSQLMVSCGRMGVSVELSGGDA